MKMDESHRAETGAFYTPKPWADKAVECLLRHVPCLDGFTVYDPAAGEGSLLDALPEGTDCFGSTLESEDCGIMLRKGHACQQFDFLHNNFRFLDDTVLSASENGSLIVLTNPPYRKLQAGECGLMRRVYPECGTDATALFLLRIAEELHPVLTCSFTKLDIYQSPNMERFRSRFGVFQRHLDGFICPSMAWPGLKGKFPIVFSVFASF